MTMVHSQLRLPGLSGPGQDVSAKTPQIAPVVGGNDSYTVLLLHCDGDDGDTTLEDASLAGRVKDIRSQYGARVVNSHYRFGNGSTYYDGGGAHFLIQPNKDFAFGETDFTIDFWAYIVDVCNPYLFCWYQTDDQWFGLERVSSRGDQIQFRIRYRKADGDVLAVTCPKHHSVAGKWMHFAIVREDTNITLYIDGEGVATGTFDADGKPYSLNLSQWPLYLGRCPRINKEGLYRYNGYLDEFRVSLTARWTTGFLPAENAYSAVGRYQLAVRGRHRIYKPTQVTARGQHSLALRRFKVTARGQNRIFRRDSVEARGVHHVRRSTQVTARGQHSLALRRFKVTARGAHNILKAYEVTARGQHRLLDVRFSVTARGQHAIWFGNKVTARGQHNRLTRHSVTARGAHRIEDDTQERWELYHQMDNPLTAADLEGAPDKTSTEMPFDSDPISGEGKHYIVVRRRNKYGLVSHNLINKMIELDADDNEIQPAPQGPFEVNVESDQNKQIRIQAYAQYLGNAVKDADYEWLIYYTWDGSDPDPDSDTPYAHPAPTADGLLMLDVGLGPFPVPEGSPIKILVRVNRTSPYARESENVDIHTAMAISQGPDAPTLTRYTGPRRPLPGFPGGQN